MKKREFKDRVYSEISSISKAFSNANRLEIIDLLANGEKSVEDIALETGISIANASQHLQWLKRERLVSTNKIGHYVYYSLASSEVYWTWRSLRDLAVSVSPRIKYLVDDFRADYGGKGSYSFKEIKDRDDIVFLDVRPKDEFEKDHIPDAVSIPIDELKENLSGIPKDKLVVTYCRGMFCSYAEEAVKILQANGYNVKRLEENVMDIKQPK